jgi:hypothetical protein
MGPDAGRQNAAGVDMVNGGSRDPRGSSGGFSKSFALATLDKEPQVGLARNLGKETRRVGR